MTAFADLPNEERMRLRGIIEDAGGSVEGYYNGNVQVAIPNPSRPFYDAIVPHFHFVQGSLHYFPLGSDNPPDAMRHDGSYPGSKAFWLYGSFHQR